jgi:predicted metal-binding protein
MHNKKPRRIGAISDADLKADLERYRGLALELGASDAKIISEKEVHVDSRVRAKCIIPKCPEYGSSAHCPPNMPEPEKIREFVQAFKHALLMKLDLDSFLIAGEGLGMADEDGKLVPTKALAELLASYRKFTGILTEIESHAFYDGHYFATAFSAASCHSVLCNFNECQVLKNKPCRFPLRSRPSMEASSLDVYRMVTEAGWDIYPIGFGCNPANVPHGTLAGLVLIC